MKFSSSVNNENQDVVAYTFKLGGDSDKIGLAIKDKRGNRTTFLYHDGWIGKFDMSAWNPNSNWAVDKFFEGDSVTITF